MIKLISLKHCLWLLVTIGAFFLGLDSRKSGKEQTGLAQQDAVKSHSGSLRGNDRNTHRRVRSSRTHLSEKKQMLGEWIAGEITEEQLMSLVNDVVKSGSSIERRLALDRILRSVRSGDISFSDVLAIRKAMRVQGADKEGKLLAYAIGAYMPEEAIRHFNGLPSEDRYGFLNDMIPGLASVSPTEAIGLFESLDSELQARVRPSFLEGLVDHGVEMATEYLYDSSDLENYHWRPMAELTRELVRDQGLEPTLNWADDLPQGRQRRDAWSAAYAVWASRDPIAAAGSINRLADGSDRNLAINGFVSAHVHQDGEMAMTWVSDISEPGLRDAAMIRVGRQYYQRDPAAAAQWYDSSGVSPLIWSQIANSVERE